MDIRERFVRSLIKSADSRILEMGPLNRPIVTRDEYPNSRYCDIRTTEEVKSLYSGNAYLEATGIYVDTNSIVDIDYVVEACYADTFRNTKFDYVIASHVLEHMDDLIFSLRDIANILAPGGVFCIVYPDKRYCFDHFRTSASFRDAYQVYRNGRQYNTGMVLDFYFSVVAENDAARFWHGDDLEDILPTSSAKVAIDRYNEALSGIRMDDVHYWPFTDMDFLKFLYDCTRANLLPFRCIAFEPTLENDQQFLIALEYDPEVCKEPEPALTALQAYMKCALPDFYTSKDIQIRNEQKTLRNKCSEQEATIERMQSQLLERDADVEKLRGQVAERDANTEWLHRQLVEHDATVKCLREQLAERITNTEWLRGQVTERNADAERLHILITERNAETTRLYEKVVEHGLQISAQAMEIKSLNDELTWKTARIAQLETIENSTFWKLTKPIRSVFDFLKRMFRKEK